MSTLSDRARLQVDTLIEALKRIPSANKDAPDKALADDVLILENELGDQRERVGNLSENLAMVAGLAETQAVEILELKAQIVLLRGIRIPEDYLEIAKRALFEAGFSGDEARNEVAASAVREGMLEANKNKFAGATLDDVRDGWGHCPQNLLPK